MSWLNNKVLTAKHWNLGRVIVERNAVTFGKAASMVTVRSKCTKIFDVDLMAKTCTCGWWDMTEMPCAHAAGYAASVDFPYERLVAPHLKLGGWRQQWEGVAMGKSLARATEYRACERLAVLETHGPTPSGAPSKRKRMHSVPSDFAKKKKQQDKNE